MLKIIFTLVCMSVALLGYSQSTSIDCEYKYEQWGFIGTVYWCSVQNSVNITSPEAAQVDSISGTHLEGYNNENVEVFYAESKEQIYYFPRGLTKFFKNIKGISIYNCSLKEIHQSDLRDFPDLRNLILSANKLEILEENLFKFNPNLEVILLSENKISHIDATVFDKLTKLRTLWLQLNTCIDRETFNNRAEVQRIIRTAKTQCINSDYSNLVQKVKNLEIEMENLNSEELKEKLENLKNEVTASNFSYFFQVKLEVLKSAQALKAKEEAKTTQAPTTTAESKRFDGCSAMESKINKLDRKMDEIKEQNRKLKENLEKIMKALNIGD